MANLTHTHHNSAPQSLFADPVHRFLVAALLIASLVPVWAATYFPSQNGPWHLLVSKMLQDYAAGGSSNYFDYYELAPHPIPHLLHTVLVAIVSFAMPVLVAHKLMISLYIVLLPLSVFYFLSAVDRQRTIYGYLSFLFVYNLPLMRGYHDYALGIPVVLFTLGYWLRTRAHPTFMRTATLAGLILLAYLSHIFNFLMLGLAISLLTLYETRRISRLMLALVPFLPTSVLIVDFAVLLLTNSVWVNRADFEMFGLPRAVEHFVQFTYTLSVTSGVAAVIPFAFAIYGVAITLRNAITEWRRSQLIAGGAFILLFGVLVLAYFAMPHKFFGWHFANTRFIPFVLVAALACAAPLKTARLRQAFLCTTAAAAGTIYLLMTLQFVRVDRQIADYVSGVDKFRTGGLLYPIDFRADGFGQIQPLTRAHEYYHIFRGGANGRGIAMFNTLTPLPYRIYPVNRQFPVWRPDDPARRAAMLADTYDHVLSWGSNPEFTQTVERKFRLIHRQGELYFYENLQEPSRRAGPPAEEDGES